MYERPTLERLGSLRSLTQFGVGTGSDLLGLWLNNSPSIDGANGCGADAGSLTPITKCRGSS